MRPLHAAIVASGLILAASGCTRAPNPVVARDPIQPPPPGYAVSCETSRWPLGIVQSRCAPAASGGAVVLRTRS